MNWENKFRTVLSIQTILFGVVIAGIITLDSSEIAKWKLYEFFGVLLASILTIFGLLQMKSLTE